MKEFCAQRVKISIFYAYFLKYLEDRSFLEETDSIFRYNALDLFFSPGKIVFIPIYKNSSTHDGVAAQ